MAEKKVVAWAAVSALAVFILVDASSYFLYPVGWNVCVKRVYSPETIQGLCELTASDRSGNNSYIYRRIDFNSKNLPLYFMNERVFHFHAEGSPDRHDMSYDIKATAFFNPESDTRTSVDVNMDGAVVIIDGVEKEFSSDKTEIFTLPAGKITEVRLAYKGHRDDADKIKIATTALPFANRGGAASWQAGLTLVRAVGYGALSVLAFFSA